MKYKFILPVILSVIVAFSCRTDDKNTEPKTENTTSETDSLNPDTMRKKDTPTIWKVNIGLLPDIQYKGPGIKALQIKPGKAAEKAGLQPGDIVTELDKIPVKSLTDYTMYLAKFKQGDFVEMTVIRGKQTIKKKVTFD
jgi:S1-C subfamily serine protease